jgi:hypothetical protein
MNLFVIPAVSGAFFDDILVILSCIGCSLMFLSALGGPRLQRLEEIGAWGTAPLAFGIFFQLSLRITDFQPDRIGFLIPMPPGLVDGLFVVSLLFFIGWWWLKRKSGAVPAPNQVDS